MSKPSTTIYPGKIANQIVRRQNKEIKTLNNLINNLEDILCARIEVSKFNLKGSPEDSIEAVINKVRISEGEYIIFKIHELMEDK